MPKIGITYNPASSLFNSSSNQTALALAELFNTLNYDVILVDTKNNDDKWWKDYPQISYIKTANLYQVSGLDYVIDIDGYIHPESRKKIAMTSIVFLRTFLQFSELDTSVYPEDDYFPRSFDDVSEIWCWDIMNPKETVDSIQTIFPCPIKTVPFIWSSSVVSHFIKDKTIKSSSDEWTVHISEKNINNTSSCIIPLVSIRELCLNKVINAKYECHNMDKMKDNKFFKENVYNNIEGDKLPIKFTSKVPYYDYLDNNNVILLSHSRFVPLRIGHINAIWAGIPLIHNSSIIKSLHPTLDMMYYNGNEISGICNAIKYFTNVPQDYYNAISSIRDVIIKKWSIAANLDKWRNILQPSLSPQPALSPQVPLNSSILIAFSDMWPGFNYNSNFIIDSIRNECSKLALNISVEGVNYSKSSVPNLLIFGPFSHIWKTVPDTIPKVYFSGENWTTPNDPSISLFISSSRAEDDTHIRIPTWMTFIDWFSDSIVLPENCEDNPIRIPVHFATNSHTKSFKDRSEFCGFVVSNPVCSLRNETFKTIDAYKKVNSGGALYNNIGGQLSLKYPGGGCGDISKYHFFSEQKFSISFENSQSPGYITEKVLHAKMAGCVPIYWGDKDTNSDFVEGSIINLSMATNPEQILTILKKLEEQPDLCSKIAATPILNQEKKDAALKQISKMSQKLLTLLGISSPVIKNKLQLDRIDNVFVVNLDSRKDRWDNLCREEPEISSISERIPAVNGKTLELTPYIYSLFKDNVFNWKKSIMGCALSHISIWERILSSTTGNLFLVLEDDVRFNKEELSKWNKYAESIPDNADLLYIGGVLPPNKKGLELVSEPINNYWAKIKPNTLFTRDNPLPLFHFCTYSYVISRNCVEKFIYHLNNSINKMTLPVDHFMGQHSLHLNTYVAHPLITRCFQDDDTSYQNAEFNNTAVSTPFDSDIYNNTECFTVEELNVFNVKQFENKTCNMYYIATNKPYELYEHQWIKDIGMDVTLKSLPNFETYVEDGAWFIVQRPYSSQFNTYFQNLHTLDKTFKVLHLSDEFGKDNISFYELPTCKGVIRNYSREDVPILPHIITIPLGYHYKGSNTKTFLDRKLVWSFHGTNWFNRKQCLEKLVEITPHNCHLIPEWNHTTITNEDQYLNTLNNSKLCPILRGNNIETFRMYECLESGTIPLYIRTDGDELYWKFINEHLSLLEIDSWDKANNMINYFVDNPDMAEKYRCILLKKWTQWKEHIKSHISKIM